MDIIKLPEEIRITNEEYNELDRATYPVVNYKGKKYVVSRGLVKGVMLMELK